MRILASREGFRLLERVAYTVRSEDSRRDSQLAGTRGSGLARSVHHGVAWGKRDVAAQAIRL